jgi:nucleoside-diphosphate-sugar epimerase
MRFFITGATGFVGGHLVEHLTQAGHEVRGMARTEAGAAVVRGFGGTAVVADIDTVAAADLAGCDVVVHAAAQLTGLDRAAYLRVNVEGTRRLLVLARAAGVPRFLLIGTEAALFDGHDLVDVDESQPYPRRQRYLYSETKAMAEALVLDANGDGLTTLSVRPRLVWGPRDTSVAPAIAEMAARGRFRWIDGGHQATSTTHVKNLARAVELAAERGHGGRAYFVADDERSTMRSFLTRLLAARGVVLPDRSAPGALLRPLARVVEGVWRLLRRRSEPPLSAFAIDMLSRSVTVKTDRARRELGWAPVISVADGLHELTSATKGAI